MYALITGASSGIGKEFAILLAKRHYNLILTARRLERLIQLKEELETTYRIHVICIPCDLSSPSNCEDLFALCQSYPIHVVINNAGFGKAGNFTKIPLEEEIQMIQTNITSVHILTKLFSAHMEHGYILNVASIAGFVPIPLMATYGATKSYVLDLTRAVNYELKKAKKNVHLGVLCPGPVCTEFNQVAGVTYDLKGISAKKCATIGLNGLLNKKEVIIPSITTKTMHTLIKLVPTRWALPVEYSLQSKKFKPQKKSTMSFLNKKKTTN